MGVEVLVLEPRPLEQSTEYIGTVKSRRSTTIQPQVSGWLTRIAVKSGDRVRSGDPLMEIDSGRQRAAVASLESLRLARQAGVEYARQQAQRQRTLLDAGAASEQEFEQAQTALRTAEAELRAIEEQIREQTVELTYYLVSAPTAGVVGDVPVRVGDRVTGSTVLTTIDSNEALELYVRVPVQQASALGRRLPVEVVDDGGAVRVETAIDFVSPQVDETTQSLLVKAPLPDGSGLRTEQFVRVRLIWREEPGLAVPIVAVSRIGGQFFAFVAEDAGEGVLARQRALRVGPIVGNDYVVLEGLAPGERLIVSGVQKIRDGAPVDPRPPGATPGPPPAPGPPRP
jgi:RND family efflux transporter MFP subunit